MRSKKLPQTLCWDCKLASGGNECPWVSEHKPVEGWDAILHHVAGNAGYDSYCVADCPLFLRDSRQGGRNWRWGRPSQSTELSTADTINLASRIIVQAAEDWKGLGEHNDLRLIGQIVHKKDIVGFFNSKWFERLLSIVSDIDPNLCRFALNIPPKKGGEQNSVSNE